MPRACAISFVLIVAGCGRGSGPPIDIVVPGGFTGPFWIVLDSTAPDIPIVDGRYQVVIPSNGVLRVRSFRPFEQWHQWSTRYDDGTSLPTESGASPGGPEAVALRGGSSAVTERNGKEIRWMPYFVGTAKQYSERPSTELPPGVDR